MRGVIRQGLGGPIRLPPPPRWRWPRLCPPPWVWLQVSTLFKPPFTGGTWDFLEERRLCQGQGVGRCHGDEGHLPRRVQARIDSFITATLAVGDGRSFRLRAPSAEASHSCLRPAGTRGTLSATPPPHGGAAVCTVPRRLRTRKAGVF